MQESGVMAKSLHFVKAFGPHLRDSDTNDPAHYETASMASDTNKAILFMGRHGPGALVSTPAVLTSIADLARSNSTSRADVLFPDLVN